MLVSAVACAALAGGVTGCSDASSDTDGRKAPAKEGQGQEEQAFEGQSADEIADKAIAATKKAQSLRLSTESAAGAQTSTADYALDTKGSCQGRNTLQDATAEMRRIGPDTYIKGNAAYWTATLKQQGGGAKAQKQAAAFKDKWVKLPPAEAKAAQSQCDKDALLAAMDNDKSERQGMTRGKDAQVQGKSTAVLHKKTAQGETLTLYVAAEGDPYILKLDEKSPKRTTTTSFSDYNKPVDVTAPPAGEVVDAAHAAKTA
jgi:hypothetical protein